MRYYVAPTLARLRGSKLEAAAQARNLVQAAHRPRGCWPIGSVAARPQAGRPKALECHCPGGLSSIFSTSTEGFYTVGFFAYCSGNPADESSPAASRSSSMARTERPPLIMHTTIVTKVKNHLIVWRYSASFINIIEAGKFPAAFGQFKDEANRCVFPVVWSFLKRAVDLISPCGFFSWFGARKTLGGVGLALKNLIIPAQEIFLVLYGFY
jgi:hypothetical protein